MPRAPELPETCAPLFEARRDDDAIGLRFEDESFSYREWIAEGIARAAWFDSLVEAGPRHVGLLLDNVPDFVFWTTGCLIAGNPIVGLNPTRSAAELASDIAHTDCQLIVTEERHYERVSDSSNNIVPFIHPITRTVDVLGSW